MEVRLRYWHTFTGATYWDDIALTNISGANLFNPVAGEDAPAPGTPGAASDAVVPGQPAEPVLGRGPRSGSRCRRAEAVTLEVYDLLGRRVALLADGAPMAAGEHDASPSSAAQLPSGTYLVVLRTASHTEARQITVVR